MANLLPKQTKSKLLWSKRVRVTLVLFVMSLFALIVAAAALLPVALYSKVVLSGIGGVQVNSAETVVDVPSFGSQRQEIIRALHRGSDLLERISTISRLPKVGELLIKVERLAVSINGIEVRLIAISAHIEQNLYILRLSGTAQSRSGVVAMRTLFEESEDFVVTDFPLGNLTPQGDEYNFIIEMAAEASIDSGESTLINKEQDE